MDEDFEPGFDLSVVQVGTLQAELAALVKREPIDHLLGLRHMHCTPRMHYRQKHYGEPCLPGENSTRPWPV